jgi:hypothetical protein
VLAPAGTLSLGASTRAAGPLTTTSVLAPTGTVSLGAATGTSDPSPPAWSGTQGSHGDPLRSAIHPGNLFGPHDQASAPRFLYIAGTRATGSGQPGTSAGEHGRDLLIRAGTGFVQNFSVAQGDKLDLRQILAGAPLTHDLTNIDKFVRVLGHGRNDPGFGPGTKTSLEISGPHGTAVLNLEGAGKLELKDLLQHHSLLLPPH